MAVKESRGAKKRCSQCGQRFGDLDTFCVQCGNPLRVGVGEPVLEADPDEAATIEFSLREGAISADESAPILAERNYIGPHYDTYMRKFEIMRSRKVKITWNWSAFLAAPFWLMFRRLYAFAIPFLILLLAAYYANPYAALVVYALEGLWAGLFGTAFFRKRIAHIVNQGRTMIEPYRSRHIRVKGDVQKAWTALSLIFAIFFCTTVSTYRYLGSVPPQTHTAQLCAAPYCFHTALTDGRYCQEHSCLAGGCLSRRVTGNQYCEEHSWMVNMCSEAGCQEETAEGGMYCLLHTCLQEGCLARRAYYSDYCHIHSQEGVSEP